MIVKTECETDGALHSTSGGGASHHGSGVAAAPRVSRSVSEVSETGGLRPEIRYPACAGPCPVSSDNTIHAELSLSTTLTLLNYYLTRICFTLHFRLLDNSTGGGWPFALIRDGGIIFPINSSAPAGGSQTSLVVLSRSTYISSFFNIQHKLAWHGNKQYVLRDLSFSTLDIRVIVPCQREQFDRRDREESAGSAWHYLARERLCFASN